MTDGGAKIAPGYVIARWRDMPNGQRADSSTNTQQRFTLSLEGTVAGWDYAVGLSHNQNKVDEKLIGGYANGPLIYEGVLTGVINPFGAQSAAGQALLDKAGATGLILYAKARRPTSTHAPAVKSATGSARAARPRSPSARSSARRSSRSRPTPPMRPSWWTPPASTPTPTAPARARCPRCTPS
jgi:iron complex outermembrane receptor protein